MLLDLPGYDHPHRRDRGARGRAWSSTSCSTRTSFGTRLDVLGANPRAAVHMGIDVPRLIVVAFLVSGGLIGLAARVDIVGVFGYMRADWNPAYGLKVVPLVFLARLNVLAVIPLAAFFGVLSIGGDYATRRADLPSDFMLLFMGLMLLFMVVTQYLSRPAGAGRADPAAPPARRRRAAPRPMPDLFTPDVPDRAGGGGHRRRRAAHVREPGRDVRGAVRASSTSASRG